MNDRLRAGLSHCASNKDCKECPYFDLFSQLCFQRVAARAIAYIQQLEEKIPQWISVEERLPDNDDYYLTYTTEHTCEVYRYDGDGEWVTAWDDTANHDITHWMPLPEPPEKGET